MRMRGYAACFAAVVGVLLSGCGSSMPVVSSSVTSALAGNWNLVGSGAFVTFPSISLAIFVNGNQVSATGTELIGCATGGGGGSVSLSGQIAADGTFQLVEPSTSLSTLNGSTVQLAIKGSVPADGSSTWSGTYAFTVTPTAGCIASQSGSFTAAAIPAFTGTYVGTLTQGVSGPSIGASLSVTQGSQTASPLAIAGVPQYYLPLTGTITVTGVSCFTHGTMSTNAINEIEGDRVSMIFTMDDGSQLFVNGSFSGTDDTSVQVTGLESLHSACSSNTGYFGTIARQ
jgi:hypothetical protein